MLETITQNIDNLENNLTLDSTYQDELQRLDEYENNLLVLRYSADGVYRVRINVQLERISSIREWIKEELKVR
jgi:hypothetical protein